MEELFIYLLKSAGVLSIFVGVYHLLLRRLTFFKSNRFFLLFGLVASIAFPLIEITQTVYVEQPVMSYSPQDFIIPAGAIVQEPLATPLIDTGQLLVLLYISISLFFLGKMAVELFSLRRLIQSGTRRFENGFVRISLSRKVTPFSFFNYICFYEKEENSAASELILKHEQVHAREWHSVDLLLTHLYCAVFWINPLAWLAKRQIGENLEFIADATAKVQNTTGISYERTLLSSAASHMQPALANNFFTPFIKKRIQMLQKETSKTWNAYKYALILPVIVLFLYSFNTVTKTEYIKSKIEVNSVVEDPLMFDITSKTTQAQMNEYVDKINNYADFKMDLKMESNELGVKIFNVYSAFGNKKLFNNFSMELKDDILMLMEVSKDQIRINNNNTKETITITAKGTTDSQISNWLYESDEQPTTPTQDSSIRFKIPPTTTKESLERIKERLKTDHNVDFSFTNLTYKEGKIIRINIKLDDNRGFKGSQTYDNNVAIPTICINGEIEGNTKSWSMGNCDRISYSSNTISYRDDILKGLQLRTDSLQSSRNETLRKMLKLRRDSLRFGDPNVTYFLSDIEYTDEDSVVYRLPNIKMYQSGLSSSSKKPPLYIVDGKEVDQEYFEIINPQFIKSVNVLKGEAATSLYGNNAKNGAIIITLKTPAERKLSSLQKYTASDSVRITGLNNSSSFMLNGGNAIKGIENLDTRAIPYIIVDGVVAKSQDLNEIDSQNIESVTVLKGTQATSLYGKAAADGAIIIVTKLDSSNNDVDFNKNNVVTGRATSFNQSSKTMTVYTPSEIKGLRGLTSKADPYILVNNKKISEEAFNNLSPQTIKLVNIWKGEAAVNKYGANAKDGVIDIVLRTPSEMKMTEDELNQQLSTNSRNTTSRTSWSVSSSTTFSITIDNFTDAEMEKFKEKLEKNDLNFKLRIFRKSNGLLTKLKFDLEGVAYTYDMNKPIKSLTVKMDDQGAKPFVSFMK